LSEQAQSEALGSKLLYFRALAKATTICEP